MTTSDSYRAPTTHNKKTRHILPIIYPIFLALLFLVLCYPNLTAPPRDNEAYATYLAHGQISDIWDVTTSSGQFPLPYIILKIWSNLFGVGLVSTRFLNIAIIFILATITYHITNRRLGFKAALIVPLILTTALSVVKNTTRPPESTIRDSLQPIVQLSSQNEPIFVANPTSFYSAVLYTTNNHPIYFYNSTITKDTSDNSGENTSSIIPLAISKINHQNSADYPAHEKFWLILDADANADANADTNTPSNTNPNQTLDAAITQAPPNLPGYRLTNLIENPYHSALEYEKERKNVL